MGPAAFRSFLDEIEHPLVKVNYDSGNSSSLGFKPAEEFAAYGERIGSFHIKDRILGGKTVPLGQGDADFDSLRAGLIDINYQGDFVLQVARGQPGDELRWLTTVNARACQWLRGETNLKRNV
jgi:hexulose-6-phosphate isomerase